MTKVIVLSDSHGLVNELESIYKFHQDESNFFIHCGDSALSKNHPVLKPYFCVRGNCDFSNFPNELILHIENKKILIVHGHHHDIRYNYDTLYNYAKSHNCELVFYGHTHYPEVYRYKDITFINPGSVLANRGIRGKTYAIVDIDNDNISVKHIDVLTRKEFIP